MVSRRDFKLSELPEIDEAHVVSLRDVESGRGLDYMVNAKDAPRAVLRGVDAKELAELWRALPEGQQDRCHIPPVGLRFLWQGQLILEASVCWQCNNIIGTDTLGGIHAEFEASAPVSRQLLERSLAAIATLKLSLG